MTRVDTYATIQENQGEAHSFQITDGAGRVIATAVDHPGPVNNRFSGQKFVYDRMGRTVSTSNPTETSALGAPSQWVTTGDDQAAGWVYTQQSYDWKSRPLVTANQDATTKTVSYTGCGCAGGEVATLTDEGTLIGNVLKKRQQIVHSDVLGRTVKTEIFDFEGTAADGIGRRLDSTTVNTYNARDQITLTRQYAGADTSGTYQETITTYDGYGRLQTQHVPEQNANTATVYTYNADDTVNTVTDARGAVATYGYSGNNRHLVTSITNTLSGSPTITTSFSYDAVGNRLSMIDSAGSVSYVYSQLAQLTSETRAFTGVGNFTLTYGYNLSGELSIIIDPFNAQVGYNHDKVGRLSAITGANFASVSSYASNLQYRAWGGLKSMTYGNSNTLSLGYDANLRTLTYEIPGLMKKSYQYYNDGRLKFTQDQLQSNSKFDRLYNYDFLGRTITALTGQEARGGATTDDRPYNETMTYDAMGHLKLRQIRQWDRSYSTGTETYVNNRRQGWQYDADGRLLSSSDSTYTYDPAGQITSFGDSDPYKTDQQLDGDGRRIKSVLQSLDPNTNQWTIEKTTYYVQSSVLGEVINEISEFGVKERGFVHARGRPIAIQNAQGTANVTWENYDASGASYRRTDAQGQSIGPGELDPLGANAGTMKPFTWPAPKSTGELEPYYGVPELNSVQQGCELDRVPMPCETVDNLKEAGAIDREQLRINEYLGLQFVHHPIQPHGAGLFTVDEEDDFPERDVDTGEDIAPRHLLPSIFHLLDDNRCSTFVSDLINVARQLTGKKPLTYDGKELALAVARQENGGFFFDSGAAGGGGGGSAFGDIFSGEATVHIIMFNTGERPIDPVGVEVSYAIVALHEIIHLAGGAASTYDGARANYFDVVLAKAANVLTDAPGYADQYDPNLPVSEVTAEMTEKAGDYWHRQLKEYCMPKEYR